MTDDDVEHFRRSMSDARPLKSDARVPEPKKKPPARARFFAQAEAIYERRRQRIVLRGGVEIEVEEGLRKTIPWFREQVEGADARARTLD